MQKLFLPAVLGAAVAFCDPAAAEVVDSADNGFTVRHERVVSAPRAEVYGAAIDDIGEWWSSAHTMSGDARNLYITTTIPGCFCEKLGEYGGLVHLTVTLVNPGVLLRLTGGLGPLGLMGVDGNLTWEFEDAEGGTLVRWQYAVGGYRDGGLGELAGPVDAVLGEQLEGLWEFVEGSGQP